MFRPRRSVWVACSIAATILVPATAAAMQSGQRGLVATTSVGTHAVGDALLAGLGGEWAEIESLGAGRWLVQWDGRVTLRGGILGQTHPYTPLIGGRAAGFGEVGYRWQSAEPWSAYTGARLALGAQIMAPWGVGLSDLRTVNNVAGVGGVNLGGALRLAAGASYLGERKSLLLGGFVQQAGRLGQVNLRGAAFTDVGVAARFDVAHTWWLSGEALWGIAPAYSDGALGFRDQTTHVALAGDLRRIFANGMWVGMQPSWAVESDTITYAASRTTYHTRNAPDFAVVVFYGYPLGAQR